MKRIIFFVIFVILVGVLAGCTLNHAENLDFVRAESSVDVFAESAYTTFIVPSAPTPDFMRFSGESQALIESWQGNFEYESERAVGEHFTTDIVRPLSDSEAFNNLVNIKITDLAQELFSFNDYGSLYARPHLHIYDGRIIGLSFDFLQYGDVSGLSAGRSITNFNLETGMPIVLDELFVPYADFRAVFADFVLEHGYSLKGDENFTFDNENIYLHVRTGETDLQNQLYTVFAMPIYLLEELWVGPASPPRIAITFDDGPHYRFTPKLLDALYERGALATFFLLGASVTNHPEIAHRMILEGHEIGNHSYSHALFTRLNNNAIRNEIERTNIAIYNATGIVPTLLRPPYGGTNSQVKEIAYQMGKAIALWSVDPRDWDYRDAIIVRDNILRHARDGSVIVLHDIHQTSIDGAIMAIDELLERGFVFVTMSQLYERADIELLPGAIYRSVYRDGRN